ncbi:class I SAM-dependent methyltransferase [Singulisphaera acidiphila]|uniref:Methylase involved in ubiquinone/menaquinone biosynthesis n=1 Tax=Singulisphaera acidiphila (strain ATCC BAA-1392 / DSM 18658 / VKM B-2454 / MOB10) TaxID=886293 RepID=L0DQI2_SINAD|nr:class I SAM-dependent methyltransferase [Singulisphaera acidiphila]AGA31170.1 methylase involved in ubiquinone/menaquinone biosynthesis [Singulisphaera acidiphila DSM 18658]
MEREELQKVFDEKCASGYDQQWSKIAPLREALHLLIGAVLSDLGDDARILCVGAGTGPELIYLAERFPAWRFVAVEPSAPMLDVCRRKAEERGIANRCEFHEGYLESLRRGDAFDAATSLLVSQFILDREARTGFFRGIAERLRPGGVLVNADLSSEASPAAYESLRGAWFRMMQDGVLTPEAIEKMRAAHDRDVALLPPVEVVEIISAGGFESPVQFLQTGLIRAWYARRV